MYKSTTTDYERDKIMMTEASEDDSAAQRVLWRKAGPGLIGL